MTTLYYSPGTASFVVHWMLIELGTPHELRLLNLEAREHKSPAYLALNPAGVVPTLVIDGVALTEAAAILLHLADADPERRFAPAFGTLERARYYQWILFCANTLQPAFRAWFYPDEPAGAANADATKQQARVHLEDAWSRIDAELDAHGPYLVGAQPTAADFLLTMLMRWSRNMPKTATAWPALAKLATAMKSRPSFAQLYAREGITDWL
jgi:glutathione S-transferase